jgi:hypothetical protein
VGASCPQRVITRVRAQQTATIDDLQHEPAPIMRARSTTTQVHLGGITFCSAMAMRFDVAYMPLCAQNAKLEQS